MYLAKETFAQPHDILKDPASPKHFEIGHDHGAAGDLYVPVSVPDQPRWAKFFGEYLPAAEFGADQIRGSPFRNKT